MSPHTKTLLRFAALAGMIVPPTALAAIALQLPADAIAGLGFDILVNGAQPKAAVSVTMETPDSGTVMLRGAADGNGTATLTAKGSATQRAGSYGFRLNGEHVGDLDVLPDAIDPVLSTIDVWTPRIEPDGNDAASVTVTLRDQYGNPLAGRIVTLVSGRSDDDVATETTQTDDNGEQHFSVRSFAPGTVTLRAIDLLSGITLADSATIRSGDTHAMGGRGSDDQGSAMAGGSRYYYAAQVANFDVIDRFEIDAPDTIPLGEEAPKITISAVDKAGNTVEDYVGTVVFSSTDRSATLPNFGKYTFKERDLGKKDFPLVLKFKQPGTQGFRVEDANDRTIFGTVEVTVEDDGMHSAAGSIAITSPKDGDTVGATSVTVEGTGPKFTNIVVLGGASDITKSTDAEGKFSVIVPLRPDQRDYSLRVQDEDKRYESNVVLVHVDAEGPTLKDVTFNPPTPLESEKVLVVAKSEAGLKSLVMTIVQAGTNAVQEVTLNPAGTPGTYQAFFTAPKPDAYAPKLVAIDAAGNTTELQTTLTVVTPGLATVTNVAAEPRVNGVSISWNELNETVDGYRVYVGETPTTFDYFLDTEKPANRATVAGLTPGTQYYFAVTALEGGRESDKSVVVTATALGLSLKAIPQDQGLQLQWTTVNADAPLSHFLLEYGLDAESLTEQRLVNRDLTEYALHDLLNGISYTLRLTPVTAGGKKLTELTATTTGTPNGTGFHPAAGDPIPFDLTTPPGDLLDHPPTNVESGIPAWVTWGTVATALMGVWYEVRRRSRNRVHAFLASLPRAR